MAIADLLTSHNEGFNKLFKTIHSESLTLSEQNKSYRTNLQQVYMAACCISIEANQSFHIANPGAGKTYAILLAANHILLNATDRSMRVVIFSIEEIVVEQLRQKAKIFPASANMLITNKWDYEAWRQLPKAVFFFDEGEQLVE